MLFVIGQLALNQQRRAAIGLSLIRLLHWAFRSTKEQQV